MQVKEKIFILRKTRYGDNDLILNCLTSSGSRISLYARSALKSKKRFGGGVLEPTHYVLALYEDKTSSRSENPLHTLKEATLIDGFPGLRTDYEKLDTALHCVGLISEIVREGDLDSGELFNLLGNTLRAIEKSDHLKELKTQFEVKLLSNQGVLEHGHEEQMLLASAISEHASLRLSEEEWSVVRARVKLVMHDYLGHARMIKGPSQPRT